MAKQTISRKYVKPAQPVKKRKPSKPRPSKEQLRLQQQVATCVGLKDLAKLDMSYEELVAAGAIVPPVCGNCGNTLRPHTYKLVRKVSDNAKKKTQITDFLVTAPLIKVGGSCISEGEVWSGFYITNESTLVDYVDDPLPVYFCNGSCSSNSATSISDIKKHAEICDAKLRIAACAMEQELVKMCADAGFKPSLVHVDSSVRVSTPRLKFKQPCGFSASFVLSYLKKHKVSVSTVGAASVAVSSRRYGSFDRNNFVCFISSKKNLRQVGDDYYLYHPSVVLKSVVDSLIAKKEAEEKENEVVQ